MTKKLLNNKEDFEKWKELNSHHILIENDEEQATLTGIEYVLDNLI